MSIPDKAWLLRNLMKEEVQRFRPRPTNEQQRLARKRAISRYLKATENTSE